jgi:hypothetical protein
MAEIHSTEGDGERDGDIFVLSKRKGGSSCDSEEEDEQQQAGVFEETDQDRARLTVDNPPSLRQREIGWRQRLLRGMISVEDLSNELQSNLQVASESLLDLLVDHLSGGMVGSTSVNDGSPVKGLSLPVAAVGWLSLQLFPPDEGSLVSNTNTVDNDSHSMSPSLRDRLSILRFLFPRATHIRLTVDEWPPAPSSRRKQRRRRRKLERVRQEAYRSNDDESLAPVLTDFLLFYDALMHRPVADMRVFPNCQVLLLDQVPLEWISNLWVIRDSLQVLRVERSCIYDLAAFLMPGDCFSSPLGYRGPLSMDPLAAPVKPAANYYSKLTHLKLSHCSLTDASGLTGSRAQQLKPPLSRLVNLRSLCLAHNQLSSEAAALSGVSNMSFLTKVDLSFNRLWTLRKVYYRLGNIQTLLLSHNRLESAEGIDRLYALETLWLDHNCIDDMSKVSSLARLPTLRSLRLKGNPLEIQMGLRAFRVELLDLFRETRRGDLPPAATYSDLQQILPILDERQASMAEMLALKARTFRPSVVERSGVDETLVIDVSVETGISERQIPGSDIVPSYPKGSIQRSKRRRAIFDRPTHYVDISVPQQSSAVTEQHGPNVNFSLSDVIRSLCDSHILEEAIHEETKPIPDKSQEDAEVWLESSYREERPTKEILSESNGERLQGADGLLLSEETADQMQPETFEDRNSTPEREMSDVSQSSGENQNLCDLADFSASSIKRDLVDALKKSTETTVDTADTKEGTVCESPAPASIANL